MQEYLDIWDENGQPTGQIFEKDFAHQNGLFHPTLHIWFYTPSPSILLQKRGSNKQTFPNLWDVSVAGHVSAGETVLDAAIREVKEEIGLVLNPSDLKHISVRKNINSFPNGIKDCEFQHVFLTLLKFPAASLILQDEEVEAVRLFSFDEIKQCMSKTHPEFKIVPADMSYYEFVMDEINKL